MGEVTGPLFTRPGPIQANQDTSKFFCGIEALDDWLKHSALKSEGRTARTYTVCQGSLVVAYYCLATGSVRRASTPSAIRRNTPDPIPVMIIGRLAVDRHFERQGIGSGMLADALKRTASVSSMAGCRAILVHAIDQSAVEFYTRYKFREYPGNSKAMFLPIEAVVAAL